MVAQQVIVMRPTFHSTFHPTTTTTTTATTISLHTHLQLIYTVNKRPLSFNRLTILSNRMSAPKYQKIKTKVGAIWSVRRKSAPNQIAGLLQVPRQQQPERGRTIQLLHLTHLFCLLLHQ